MQLWASDYKPGQYQLQLKANNNNSWQAILSIGLIYFIT